MINTAETRKFCMLGSLFYSKHIVVGCSSVRNNVLGVIVERFNVGKGKKFRTIGIQHRDSLFHGRVRFYLASFQPRNQRAASLGKEFQFWITQFRNIFNTSLNAYGQSGRFTEVSERIGDINTSGVTSRGEFDIQEFYRNVCGLRSNCSDALIDRGQGTRVCVAFFILHFDECIPRYFGIDTCCVGRPLSSPSLFLNLIIGIVHRAPLLAGIKTVPVSKSSVSADIVMANRSRLTLT